MRKWLMILSFAFGLFLAISILPAYAADDPCLGPRGDKTFTFQEFLTLFSAKLNDDKTAYQIAWPCENDSTFHFIISKEDVHDIVLSTSESFYPRGLFFSDSRRTRQYVFLKIDIESLSYLIPVQREKVELQVLYSEIPLISESDELTPASYRKRRELYAKLRQILSKNTEPESITLKDIRVHMYESQIYGCPIPGKPQTPYLNLDFSNPSGIFIKNRILWKNKL